MKKIFTRNSIITKIREDFGTFKHFCKLQDINRNTARVVIRGDGKSQKIANILIKHKYIKNAKELGK